MTQRLSSLDVSFLYLEQPATAMHTGSVMIFRPAPRRGVDVDRLTRYIGSKILSTPRYRQRVRTIPGRLANPIWVDDEHFDLSYHVREAVLPKPGKDEQLADLVARLEARPLDRRHPLWELYIVQGLAGGRFALVSKVHQALVDGVNAVDIGQLILDDDPKRGELPEINWTPQPMPGTAEMITEAIADTVRRPGQLADSLRGGLVDVRDTANDVARNAGKVLRAVRRLAGGPPRSPLAQAVSPHRRFSMVTTKLEDYRTIRNRAMTVSASLGGRSAPGLHTTVNDVVLAVLAGALRSWLMTRGEGVGVGSSVRTLVPMSVLPTEPGDPVPLGSRVASLLIDLPTGETSPMMRLHQVAYQTTAYRDSGRAVDAGALAGIAGFAPPTLHSLGARVASGLSNRMFQLVVTNVPGPQHPLFADGARLLSGFPVIPLAAGQVLSIGLTSYAGSVHYGLNADREAMPDVELVGHCITDALAELLEAVQ